MAGKDTATFVRRMLKEIEGADNRKINQRRRERETRQRLQKELST